MTGPNLVAPLSMLITGGPLSLSLILSLSLLRLPPYVESFVPDKFAFPPAGGDGSMLAVCPADWRSTCTGCHRAPVLKRKEYPK
jgi:hypothetical protein